MSIVNPLFNFLRNIRQEKERRRRGRKIFRNILILSMNSFNLADKLISLVVAEVHRRVVTASPVLTVRRL